MSDSERIELPLLHDHHSHASLYAAFEGLPDFGGLDRGSALELLACLPRDRLSLVKGWRTDAFGLGAADLAGMPPAMIVNASLHGFAATPAARDAIDGLWPELARRSGDASWGERNLPELFAFYERVAGLDEGKLDSFMSRMEAIGIGSLEDMTVSGDAVFDLIAASPYAERIRGWASLTSYRSLAHASRKRCAGIKIFLDGSLGARSAALDAPFADGSRGALLYADGELASILAEIASFGARLSAHAIGHEAIRQVLRCLVGLRREGIELREPRLEHVQFIGVEDARLCRDLGVALSMQPNFNYDSMDYADRLIPRHREENDPFRMLIDEAGFVPGHDLLFGSDGMPHGAEAALTQCLFPAFGSQRLSVPELITGYGEAANCSKKTARYEVSQTDRTVRLLTP